MREPVLPPAHLAAAERGELDREALALGLKAAGLDPTEELVGALTAEAADHAARVALEERGRDALAALDRPSYELPQLPDTVDLAGLYELAAALEAQGMRDEQAHEQAGEQDPDQGPGLDVDAVLDSAKILVCCGSGGVGKTTTAAALALRAAERGRRVVVLTIDPARRLAQSMGLSELDNTPRRVEAVDGTKGGSLDAMMLDMKRTFDEIVVTHAEPGKAEAILENPFYQALSSSFAGTQEYMAMEKLGQLKARVRLRPDRRRHPADPVGAGLPRRPRAADDLPRRPHGADPARAGQGGRQGLPQGRHDRLQRLHQRDHADHRRAGAAGRLAVRRGARDDVRRLPRAGPGDVRPAQGAGHVLRRRGRTGARRAARGVLLRRAARRGVACRSPGWSSTGCTAPAARP